MNEPYNCPCKVCTWYERCGECTRIIMSHNALQSSQSLKPIAQKSHTEFTRAEAIAAIDAMIEANDALANAITKLKTIVGYEQ